MVANIQYFSGLNVYFYGAFHKTNYFKETLQKMMMLLLLISLYLHALVTFSILELDDYILWWYKQSVSCHLLFDSLHEYTVWIHI